MAKVNDLTGKKFGKLTVVSRAGNSKTGKAMWNCVCDCGKQKKNPVSGYDLKSGKVRSCGCLYFECNKGSNKTHGKSKTRLYHVWSSMKGRCQNQNATEYSNYGGRGIRVCNAWMKDFEEFERWAIASGYKELPHGECTLDRINSDGDYSPENCRWVNMKRQNNNRRNNRKVVVGGKKFSLTEASNMSGIEPATLCWRIDNGWKENELFIPANLNNRNIRRMHNA